MNPMKAYKILHICKDHLEFMWAAQIAGIILDKDFRDVNKADVEKEIKVLQQRQLALIGLTEQSEKLNGYEGDE